MHSYSELTWVMFIQATDLGKSCISVTLRISEALRLQQTPKHLQKNELTRSRFEETKQTGKGKLSTIEPERIWIFGDKILASKFADKMMHVTFDKHHLGGGLPPHDAEYVFANTAQGSKLRSFTVDQVQARTPFDLEDSQDEKVWLVSIAKGGDLVDECICAEGFHGMSGKKHPAAPKNWRKYMRDINPISVEEWLKKDVQERMTLRFLTDMAYHGTR